MGGGVQKGGREGGRKTSLGKCPTQKKKLSICARHPFLNGTVVIKALGQKKKTSKTWEEKYETRLEVQRGTQEKNQMAVLNRKKERQVLPKKKRSGGEASWLRTRKTVENTLVETHNSSELTRGGLGEAPFRPLKED